MALFSGNTGDKTNQRRPHICITGISKCKYNIPDYWEIGEGPCGPDTEMFYDTGKPACGPDCQPSCDCGKYVEIWNNVFSQFNSKEGLDRSEYPLLPNQNIDTGMGLERMACVLQGVETNFDTDLFLPIIKEVENIAKLSNIKEIDRAERQKKKEDLQR